MTSSQKVLYVISLLTVVVLVNIYSLLYNVNLCFIRKDLNKNTTLYKVVKRPLMSGSKRVILINNGTNTLNASSFGENGGKHIHIGFPALPLTIRSTSCNGCFAHNFRYIINNVNICSTTNASTVRSIDLIVMIPTIHEHFDQRMAIRDTWLSIAEKNTANIRYVFLLGETSDKALRYRIQRENEIFHDIVKENFIDSYRNLTIKTAMGYKWIVNYCWSAKYVMKADDDMFVNIWNVLRFVRTRGHILNNNLAGSCSSARPNRNKKSKWYTSFKDYNDTKYPGFCSGTAYVTSMTLAEKIYNVTSDTPFFHLEDVYIGLCLYKIRGNIINLRGFRRSFVKPDPCEYLSLRFYTSHNVSASLMYDMWNGKCRSRSGLKPR